MKYIKSLLALIFAISVPATVLAADTAPSDPFEKISWAIALSGPMPKPMIIGFVLLGAITIITILISFMKGDKTNE